MIGSRGDSLRWASDGTEKVIHAVGNLEREDYDEASLLPGWNRRQVVAHLAANAEALTNLVTWARTGRPTPMYSCPEDRAAGIDRGLRKSPTALSAWVRDSARVLESAWSELDDDQWSAGVVTAGVAKSRRARSHGLRGREVWVHLVDLDLGQGFEDLPLDFSGALRADVLARRGAVPELDAPSAAELAWLTGGPHGMSDAPALPPWL